MNKGGRSSDVGGKKILPVDTHARVASMHCKWPSSRSMVRRPQQWDLEAGEVAKVGSSMIEMPLPRKPSCRWKVGILGSEAPVPVSAAIFGWRPMFLAAGRNCQTPLAPAACCLFLPRKCERDTERGGERQEEYPLRWARPGADASGFLPLRLPLPPPSPAGCRCGMLRRSPARRAADDDHGAYVRNVCVCVPSARNVYVRVRALSLIRRHVGEGEGTLRACQVRLYAPAVGYLVLSCPFGEPKASKVGRPPPVRRPGNAESRPSARQAGRDFCCAGQLRDGRRNCPSPS